MTSEMSKKASFKNSILPFSMTIIFVLALRWIFFEPFVIPSGSLIPSLLIYDHVLVSKYDYGLRLPWSKTWVFNWSAPKPADIVVFRSKHEDSYFMIKRLMATGGDRVRLDDQGVVYINDQKIKRVKVSLTDPKIIKKYGKLAIPARLQESIDSVDVYEEHYNGKSYLTMYSKWHRQPRVFEYKVPKGEYFFMGDNRDNSSDSRYWGSLQANHLIGAARFIWLSCDYVLKSLPFLCQPSSIRTQRIFTRIN